MYRFLLSPRWLLFHLVMAALIVVMISLGFWQLRRLDERQAFNSAVTAQSDRPPFPIDDIIDDADAGTSHEWARVEATGTYLPDEQVAVVNRSVNGAAGEIVVTPLRLDDGRILLVERGFVPLGVDDVAPPPEGAVSITGRIRPTQERRRGQLSDPGRGDLTEVQRLDIERLAPQLPGDVVPFFVELTEQSPASSGTYPSLLPEPELSEGSHLSYAIQWFTFSLAAVVGWVLAVRHSLNARRGASRTSGGGPGAAGSTMVIDATASSSR